MLPYSLILISVFSYALFPLVIASLPSNQVPTPVFLLTLSVVSAVVLVLSSIFLLGRMGQGGRALGWGHLFRLATTRRALQLGFANAVLNNLGYGFLFLAIQSGLVLTGAVLYELWSTVFLIASWKLRQNKQGAFVARQGRPTTVAFFIIGAIGLLILAYSGAVSESAGVHETINWLGLAFALMSPIAMGLSFVLGTENGQRIARHLQDQAAIEEQPARITGGAVSSMLLRVFTMLIQSLFLVVLLMTGTTTLPDAATFETLWPVLLAAGALVAVGGSFSTIGNTLASKANLNLLYYFVPFLTLLALYVFDFIESIGSLAFFGCILVLAANYVLTATYEHSTACRCASGGICLASAVVLYTPGLGVALRVELVAVLLGLFGILAAFLIDRMARDGDRLFGAARGSENTMTVKQSQAFESYGQNIFVLWTLAFGSLALLFLFRTGGDDMYDFFAVVTAVAVLYMSLLPVDLMQRFSPLWASQQDERAALTYEQLVLSLLVSVTFLFGLLSLLLLALRA
jgi:drug/metabolite transporter (DMT)-like permease